MQDQYERYFCTDLADSSTKDAQLDPGLPKGKDRDRWALLSLRVLVRGFVSVTI